MKHHLALILLFILIAGCSPETVTTPTNTPAPTMTSSPIPATTTLTPSPLPPTVTLTPFVPKATIKIASQSPLSGDRAFRGIDIMRGAELAVKQLAAPLMELGYKIELVPHDDKNDFGVAVDVAKEIVADPDILCGVGPYASRILNQVKEIYHQAGLAFVSPSVTAAFVSESGYLEVNRVVGRSDGQGAVGAQFAKAQGFSRVFVISQSGDFTQFNAYHFRNEASRLGIEVVGNTTADNAKDFGSLIDRVMTANSDLVYFSTLSVEQAGAFFREARAAGYQGAFLGNEGIDNPALLEFAGPLVIDGGGMYYTAIAAPASYYPEAAGFLEGFGTLYDVTPQLYSAQAYDSAGICMKAIEEASKVKEGEIPTRTEVASAIRALQDYNGITGIYNFNKNGDPNPATYFVFQVVSADPNDWDQNTLVASFEIAPPE
ncbi:MAG TPA: branched-chain amino acid ABC transporter substrate-binding protein [Anaerolineales bacterium]|nr:branched-chain amino acid ABC transporter substrate-binding protein [Anaerolineales bacterium]